MSYPICEDDIKMIEATVSSIELAEKSISEGSDEHLDLILDTGNALSKNTELLKKIVDDIEIKFNSYTPEKARLLLAKIFPVFRLAESLNAIIKSVGIYNELGNQLVAFNDEVKELLEMANDLSRYKINVTNDYNSLFND